MAGQMRYAHRLANHLEAPVDAACMISEPDGADASAAEIRVDGTGWLAVGRDAFALLEGDAWMGRPRGRPIAVIPYDEVVTVAVTRRTTTARADLELRDHRTVTFETRCVASDLASLEVLELLSRRCATVRRGCGRTRASQTA